MSDLAHRQVVFFIAKCSRPALTARPPFCDQMSPARRSALTARPPFCDQMSPARRSALTARPPFCDQMSPARRSALGRLCWPFGRVQWLQGSSAGRSPWLGRRPFDVVVCWHCSLAGSPIPIRQIAYLRLVITFAVLSKFYVTFLPFAGSCILFSDEKPKKVKWFCRITMHLARLKKNIAKSRSGITGILSASHQ